ncbi:MAG: hypothetical protein WC701_12145 [Kiritimatiellales bacterium]|jgi:hypothetical protein
MNHRYKPYRNVFFLNQPAAAPPQNHEPLKSLTADTGSIIRPPSAS